MAFLEHKLNLKVQQKTVLTPSLMQMVSLLALNKLELTEMIQAELVQNPVLEEGTEIVEGTEVAVAESNGDLSLAHDGAEAPAALEFDTLDAGYAEINQRENIVADNVEAKPPETDAEGDPYGDMDFKDFDNYLNDGASRPKE